MGQLASASQIWWTSTSYSRSWSYGSSTASNSALFLQSTQNAKLVNCSFCDNLGTALTVRSTSITLAGKSDFILNRCGRQLLTSDDVIRQFGCGVTAFNSNLTFAGNTSILENNQTASYKYNKCAESI